MKRGYQYVVLAAGLGLVAAVMSLTSAGPALAQRTVGAVTAIIANDASNPVPIKNVDAVTVTEVLTDARNPLHVTNVGGVVATSSSGEPFHHDVNLGPTFTSLFVVPAGSRALIRYVSGSCNRSGSGTALYVAVETAIPNQGDVTVRHTFPLIPNSTTQWVFAQHTFIHASHTVVGAVGTDPGFASITCRLTLSGELFPLE
jgi:hypothetical protein